MIDTFHNIHAYILDRFREAIDRMPQYKEAAHHGSQPCTKIYIGILVQNYWMSSVLATIMWHTQ